MTIYSLDVFLSQFWTSPLLRVQFCCFLSCIQVSQETDKVIWYSRIFKNFPQFVVIHRVKGFGLVNEAELDVFLEFPCFLYDPMDVGNLISGSSAFSKSSLYIWKFSVHILLKPSLKDFEYYLASMWWQPTPVLLTGGSHGWRSVVGCSPWGRRESDMTERLHFHFSLSCIGEGNGNPLQCSYLDSPRDGGAWWAAIYGVSQSWTLLKWLSSMWNESSCAVVWTFFSIVLLWDWNENWPFLVLWPLLSFPNLLAYWVQHFHSIVF